MSSPIERKKRLLRKVRYLAWITCFSFVLGIGWLIYSKPSKEEMQKTSTAAVKKEIERCKTIPPKECRLAVRGKPMTGTDVFLLLSGLIVVLGGTAGLLAWKDSRRRKKRKQ